MTRICTAGPAGNRCDAEHRRMGRSRSRHQKECGRASFFDHLVAKRAGSSFLEPLFGKLWRREYLEMVDVANLLVDIDVDPNGRHWSLFSFRFPHCVSLRDELNTRSTFRLRALSMPMRACISGPRSSAAMISASTAVCHASRFCSAFGSFMM